MFSTTTFTYLLIASIVSLPYVFASPVGMRLQERAVTELNREAFEEAHKRDAGATRAFSNVQIKTSDGQCLFIDELSGDFRANLVPVQIATCGSTQGQSWDIITSGLHNDAPGKVLVVNTLTQACLDFNQGRAGREVTTFSCGGRAAGEGIVTPDQLFSVPADGSSFGLATDRSTADKNCIAVVGSALGKATCAAGTAAQQFSIGANGGNNTDTPPVQSEPVASTPTAAPSSPTQPPVANPDDNTGCTITTLANPNTVTIVQTVTVAAASAATKISAVY